MPDDLTLNEYQRRAATTAVYRDKLTSHAARIEYVFRGLVDEIGEIAGHLKRVLRDDDTDGEPSTARRGALGLELGDLLWYVATMAEELGYDLQTIAGMNLVKLAKRAGTGTICGKGDER